MITVFYQPKLSGRVHNRHFITSYYWAKLTTENGSRESSLHFQANDFSRRHCRDTNKRIFFICPRGHNFVQR